MKIESIRHKALRRLYLDGQARGVIEPERIRRILTHLNFVASLEELAVPPNFGFHALTGERKGYLPSR